jgi:spermidine dehydrogenase
MSITRRDFCQGTALALGSLPLLHAPAAPASPEYYPPRLTGLRGSHPGSFEAAHAMALEGRRIAPVAPDGPGYDLAVVGAGISGLACAWFWRRRHPDARILILDNHDDFGGHAKRNEFVHRGRVILAHGGSQSIDSPGSYSPAAARLLRDLGIDTARFHEYYDKGFAGRHGLGTAVFFDAAHYGTGRLVKSGAAGWRVWPEDPAAFAREAPIAEEARADLVRLLTERRDYLPDLDVEGKTRLLGSITGDAFLRDIVRVHEDVIALFRAWPQGLWGVGTDALPALELFNLGFPGFAGMGLPEPPGGEPYIFHFPDGNASIARLLVRDLVPGVAPGTTMEDVVTASFDYAALDREDSPVRLRLRSTVMEVSQDRDFVTLQYIRDGELRAARARHAVLACWHTVIPHICPSLPEAQKEALRYQVKTPLVYTNVLLDNWRALERLGVANVYAPRGYYYWTMLDFPVSMDGYRYAAGPDEPAVLLLIRTPNVPGSGLPPKEQFRQGRREILATTFETFEKETRGQLAEMFGPGGFDADRDIAGITVNRWPHGYAYEYLPLWDGEWAEGEAPHEIARRPFGRIGIANSDAEAHAYVDGAIDAAWRAIEALG